MSKNEGIAEAEDNSSCSLMILDLLSAKFLPIEEVGHLRKYMPSFFASETYKQTQDKKEMFDSTQSDERNIRSFRANSAYALVVGLFLITFTGMLAAAVALVAFVNPVAGFVILGLAVAFSLYFGNNRLLDQMASLEKHFTKIDEQIQLGTDGQNLFSDLDELVKCAGIDSASVPSI